MDWLKENWFKIAILLFLLVCAALVFLYEARQQNIEKQEQLSNLTTACQKLASQKKVELSQNSSALDNLILGSIYEYKYNPSYGACILAYDGTYVPTGIFSGLLGHNLFEVDNLTTGEALMSVRVDPGDSYREANTTFMRFREQYIGSTTPIK